MKIRFPSDWQALIQFFNQEKVRYLIVGGVAANYHGQPRYTQDIDFFIDRSIDNAHAIKRALERFGFGSLSISVDDLTRPGFVIMLGKPPNRVDLITDIQPLVFEDAWNRRSEVDFGSDKINIISIEDLISAKKSAGRPKDLADLFVLEKIVAKHPKKE